MPPATIPHAAAGAIALGSAPIATMARKGGLLLWPVCGMTARMLARGVLMFRGASFRIASQLRNFYSKSIAGK